MVRLTPPGLLALSLICAATPSITAAQSATGFDPVIQREFVQGMTDYSHRNYRSAEAAFRRILDRDPSLLRVRLELARTLFMEKKDEQADYQFRLAAAAHPGEMVARNIVRFRQAIRNRRSWRFNIDFGFAPDSNINSATDKQSVDIYGLPFRLNSDARAHSGTGLFFGGDASIRLNRDRLPIYISGYGHWVRYSDHRFDDGYVGGEAGPEIPLAGGRLRTTVTGLARWYGGKPLEKSFGAHFAYEKLLGNLWTLGGALLVRRNDYSGRSDVDAWDVEARVSVDRPLGPALLGFAYATVERDWAHESGQAFKRASLGIGVQKEIGWGLRPQLAVDVAREVNDGPLAPFGIKRSDWLIEGSASIYKRDWNLGGFAPSLSVTFTRNRSTLPLYDQKRLRGEVRLTRAF